jgi:hypothetical protein
VRSREPRNVTDIEPRIGAMLNHGRICFHFSP